MGLILWSGGCDSTLLLFQMATKALAAGDAPPRALSVSYDDQIPAGEQHRTARLRILKEFRRRGLKVDHSEFVFTKQGDFGLERPPGLGQPILWLGFGQSCLMEDEDLYLGYVRGDDIWHYREHIVSTFSSMQQVSKKSGSLYFPLEWESKDEVLSQLADAKLLKFVWYCETVRGSLTKPCGWCPSCKTMAAGRYLAKRKWGYDKPPTDEPETKDEPKKPKPRPRREAQRKKALARDRRSRPSAANSARKASRSRRV